MKAKRIAFVALIVVCGIFQVSMRVLPQLLQYERERTVDYTVEYKDVLDQSLGEWRVVKHRTRRAADLNEDPETPAWKVRKKRYRIWEIEYADDSGQPRTFELHNMVMDRFIPTHEEWILYTLDRHRVEVLEAYLSEQTLPQAFPTVHIVYQYRRNPLHLACPDGQAEALLENLHLDEPPRAMLAREDVCIAYGLDREGISSYEEAREAAELLRTALNELAGAPVNLYISIPHTYPHNERDKGFLWAGEADLSASLPDQGDGTFGWGQQRCLEDYYQYFWIN